MNDSHLAGLSFWERLAVAILVRSRRTSLVVVKEYGTREVFVAADQSDPVARYVVTNDDGCEPVSMLLERLYHAPSYGEHE